MITKFDLEKMKENAIEDCKTERLKDLSNINIDSDKPVEEKIHSFIEQINNPYLFMVGNVTVKASFTSKAPTLQQSLEILLTKNI